MILLRTTELASEALALADSLQAAAGLPVVMLVDERRGSAGECRFPKLGLTRESYAGLGLHLPADVGWRCGDYGFYLARQAFSDVDFFWMIEFDVRIADDARRFFKAARASDADLLAARLQPAEFGWWWLPFLAASDAAPWRCFFPVVRLSTRAIDVLHRKRKQHSREWTRTALWPNDEGFVATTVVHAGLRHADLNALGGFYDDATFSYENVLHGDEVAAAEGPRLLHPVLTGDAYRKKRERVAASRRPDPLSFRLRRAALRRINQWRGW